MDNSMNPQEVKLIQTKTLIGEGKEKRVITEYMMVILWVSMTRQSARYVGALRGKFVSGAPQTINRKTVWIQTHIIGYNLRYWANRDNIVIHRYPANATVQVELTDGTPLVKFERRGNRRTYWYWEKGEENHGKR
jgi:hypothetical protein